MKTFRFFLAALVCFVSIGTQAQSNVLKNKKVLVIYYSRTANTAAVAKNIQAFTKGDIYEITPEQPYSDDFNKCLKEFMEEKNSGNPRAIKKVTCDIKSYDVIFVGSPIWGGSLSQPVKRFLSDYNLKGKTVIPFVTFGNGGPGQSLNEVKALQKEATVLDIFGIHGTPDGSKQAVDEWLNRL